MWATYSLRTRSGPLPYNKMDYLWINDIFNKTSQYYDFPALMCSSMMTFPNNWVFTYFLDLQRLTCSLTITSVWFVFCRQILLDQIYWRICAPDIAWTKVLTMSSKYSNTNKPGDVCFGHLNRSYQAKYRLHIHTEPSAVWTMKQLLIFFGNVILPPRNFPSFCNIAYLTTLIFYIKMFVWVLQCPRLLQKKEFYIINPFLYRE